MALSKSSREQNISWGGIISLGKEPDSGDEEKFSGPKGLVYRIGYQSKRILHVQNESIEVTSRRGI